MKNYKYHIKRGNNIYSLRMYGDVVSKEDADNFIERAKLDRDKVIKIKVKNGYIVYIKTCIKI